MTIDEQIKWLLENPWTAIKCTSKENHTQIKDILEIMGVQTTTFQTRPGSPKTNAYYIKVRGKYE